jgi:hypothetical protein
MGKDDEKFMTADGVHVDVGMTVYDASKVSCQGVTVERLSTGHYYGDCAVYRARYGGTSYLPLRDAFSTRAGALQARIDKRQERVTKLEREIERNTVEIDKLRKRLAKEQRP